MSHMNRPLSKLDDTKVPKKVYHSWASGVDNDKGRKVRHPYTEVGFKFDKDKT